MISSNLSLYLNGFLFKNSFFDAFVYFLANILPFIVFFLIIAYFIVKRKSILKFIFVTILGATSWGLSEILKEIFSKERPFVLLESINPLFLMTEKDSFPSGHAMVMASLSMLIYFENKKLGILSFFATLLVGLARVFAGVHFLEDILFGYLFGVVFVIISYKYFKKLKNKTGKSED